MIAKFGIDKDLRPRKVLEDAIDIGLYRLLQPVFNESIFTLLAFLRSINIARESPTLLEHTFFRYDFDNFDVHCLEARCCPKRCYDGSETIISVLVWKHAWLYGTKNYIALTK